VLLETDQDDENHVLLVKRTRVHGAYCNLKSTPILPRSTTANSGEIDAVDERSSTSSNWSMFEGHLLQMGGIIFRIGEDYRYINLNDMLREKSFALKKLTNLHSVVTRQEIEDRSKADSLAKAIVLLQIVWFTVQCIGRAAQGLAITELEIITLAYTSINGAMCLFWWSKPLDVQCPVVVALDESEWRHDCELLKKDPSSMENPVWGSTINPILEAIERWKGEKQYNLPSSHTKPVPPESKNPLVKYYGFVSYRLSQLGGLYSQDFKPGTSARQSYPFSIYVPNVRGSGSCEKRYYLGAALPFFLAILFGSVHCIGWSLSFPTPTARMMWRVCSLCITVAPVWVMIPLIHMIFSEATAAAFLRLSIPVCVLLWWIYGISRIVLVCLAVWGLTAMPATAHTSVQWTELIPHI
jgi:hypothetical protein